MILASLALAQEIPDVDLDAQLYRMPVDATATMWADDSHLSPGPSGRLAVGYVKEPFVWIWDDGERVAVVDDALGIDAIAGYAVWRLRAAVDVPIYALATGEAGSGAGLGDIAVDLKGTLLDREDAPVGIALGARLAFPTSTTAIPLGGSGVAWEIEAIVDRRFGDLVAAVNLGTRGVPDVALDNLDVSDVFLYRVGAGYGIGESAGVSVDLAGQFTYGEPGNAAGSTMEAMLGGWLQVSEPLTLRAGVGRGLGSGIGAPTARGVLALAWQPGPPAAAKTKTPKPAKPDPAATAKPVKSVEQPFLIVPGDTTIAPGLVHIKVTNLEGAPLDATWLFGTVARGPVTAGLGMAKVPPGSWSILVWAEGYGTQGLGIEVESGMTSHLEAKLMPARVRVIPEKVEMLERIRFDGTVLTADSRKTLDEVAAMLRAHPEITAIRIEGHTDSRGLAEDNLTLSGARASAVLAYLVDKGLDPNRFMAAGYGESRPVDLTETPGAWERNQRIELVITGREP